jgi:chemotaxis protein MotA
LVISTLAGFAFGIAAIVISIMMEGNLSNFFNIASIFIVLGGTIASTMISYPAKELKKIFALTKFVITKDKVDIKEDIETIIKLANLARKEGLLALEDAIGDMKDPFMKNGILLILDGTDPELIKSVLETEIFFMEERHTGARKIFESMASYAPAYGMIGTLIGLINMLVNLNDSDALGPAMAIALVTTFYGVILANLVFTPMANQLALRSKREQLQKEIIIEGILSIQDGENPRVIKDKLMAFISKEEAGEEPEKDTAQKNEELAHE